MSTRATLILAVAVLAAFFSSSPGFGQTWTIAPPNPEYVKYLESLKSLKTETAPPRALLADGEQFVPGEIPMQLDLSHLTVPGSTTASKTPPRLTSGSFPPWYDLRVLGRLTPVKNQGGYCGSCWAFASYGSMESNLMPWETWDFSEEHLKNATTCCDGGNPSIATTYLARWAGAVDEAADPYEPYDPDPDCAPADPPPPVVKHVQDVYLLPRRKGFYTPGCNDDIKQAIMQYGAMYASMYWDQSGYNYSTSAFYSSMMTSTNHGICLVGWDDNYSRENFRADMRPPGDGAFICKNSWGTYGESGYFYLSYYQYAFGSALAVFRGEATPALLQQYMYDPNGWSTSVGCGTDTAWCGNVFTATSTARLGAVGVYSTQSNTQYELYIYLDPTNGPINPGGPVYTRTGTLTYSGYNTIRLSQPVQVTSGQRFSVVMKLITPGYSQPIPVEEGTANPGEGYISSNGTAWTDITAQYAGASVCVKAFTAEGFGLTVTPDTPTYAYGPAVGGYVPSTVAFTVTNTSGQTLGWSASDTADWVDLSPASGYLTPGAFTTVTATINSLINERDPGLYTDNITFSAGGIPVAVRHIAAKVGAELSARPTRPVLFSGPTGGPFTPTGDRTYHLFNNGLGGTWTSSSSENWVTLTPSSGTIDQTGYASAVVSVNSNASTLAPGTHNAWIDFTTSRGAYAYRQVTLTVKGGSLTVTCPVLQFGGPAGGPFYPSATTCTLSNDGASINWQATPSQSWITVSPSSGTLGYGQSVNVSVSANSNAYGFPEGPYAGSISFVNTTNGVGNTNRPVSLGIGPIRVKPDGSDGNNGASWSAAKQTIQGAIDFAMPGQEVWVAAGNYEKSLTMKNNVSLYGGFQGSETNRNQRDPSQNQTQITSMWPDVNAVKATDVSEIGTTIDGFRIWNAGNIGIRCTGSCLTISNNLIDDNYLGGIMCEDHSTMVITDNEIMGNPGPGIRSEWSTVTITDNAIYGNCEWGPNWSGGVCIIGGDMATVTGNVISDNYCYGSGAGGLDLLCSEGTLTGNTITGNHGGTAGVKACGMLTIARNIITGNQGSQYGGLAVENLYGTIDANVIAGNTGGGFYGFDGVGGDITNNTICDNTGIGMDFQCDCSPNVANNIVAFNTVGIRSGGFGEAQANPLLANNDVYGNTTNYVDIAPGATDISVEPQFVKRTERDYHLLSLSPCIDTGAAQVTDPLDADGNPRPRDGDGNGSAGWDIGAYEFQPDLTILRRTVPNGTPVTLSGVSVTACFLNAEPGKNWIYVENADRTYGIRVRTSLTHAVNARVNVSGTMQTDTVNGERYIDADAGSPVSAGGTHNIATLGMRTEWLGGAASGPIPVLRDGFGFYNTGMLVQTWGNANYVNEAGRYMYVNDGCHLWDGSGFYGVKVLVPPGIPMPMAGHFVKVTGIASAVKIGSNYVRVVRPRSAADIEETAYWYWDPVEITDGCWNMLTIPGIPYYSWVEGVFQAPSWEPPIVLDGYLKRYDPVSQWWIVYQYCSTIMNALVAEGYGLYIPPGGANSYDYYRTPVTGDQLISLPRGSNPLGNFSFVGDPFDYNHQWSSIKITDGNSVIPLPTAVSFGWIHRIDRWTGTAWTPVTDLSTGQMTKRTAYLIYPRVNNLAMVVAE